MESSNEFDMSDISGQNTVFWSTGNRPTQTVYGMSVDVVSLNLKALFLLSHRVVGAGSFFYESEITIAVTMDLLPLFERGDILYFIDEALENYTEHGARKAEKSPEGLSVYHDRERVERLGQKLDALGHILRRPSHDISARIADLWIEDLYSKDPGTLDYYLSDICSNQEQEYASIVLRIIDIVKNRGEEDFVWEYIGPKLLKVELPQNLIRVARRRLAQMYAVATAEILGVPLDRSSAGMLSSRVTSQSKFDPSLFLSCMEVLGLTDVLRRLNAYDLIALKQSPEFSWFKSFYFLLIESVEYQSQQVVDWLPKYRDAAQRYPGMGMSINTFLENFRYLCGSLDQTSFKYSRPLEVLIRAYNALRTAPIDGFVEKMRSFGEAKESFDSVKSYECLIDPASLQINVPEDSIIDHSQISIQGEQAHAHPSNATRISIDVLGLIEALVNMPSGNEHANEYHNLIIKIFVALFSPTIYNPEKEQDIDQKTKRIDVVFNNRADWGFFGDLSRIHSVHCPYLIVECKNYSNEISNEELDQLAGRLNEQRSMLGILTCRKIERRDRVIIRQQSHLKNRKVIIVLDDSDLMALLRLRKDNRFNDIYSLMDEKYKELVM